MNPIRVGIIGASPDRGWAATAHIPALLAMPAFALTAICTTRQESAEATARKFNVPHAVADWRELVARPDIDLVLITAKVSTHYQPVLGAFAAGKHVFCEWPLALDTAQAEAMLAAARASGKQHMVGLQGRAHPVLQHVKQMLEGGEIGRVISCTFTSSLASWGPRLPPAEAYRADRENGATGLTIPGGHSLDTLRSVLGEFAELSAILTTQHPRTEIIGENRTLAVTSADQVLVHGRLVSGAVLSVHVKADMAVPMGVRLEINGTEGDLLIQSHTAPGKDPVGLQRADLIVSHARRGIPGYVAVEIPVDGTLSGAPLYTGRLLARLAEGIRTGKPVAPDFADAVSLHRLLDEVQTASDTGRRRPDLGSRGGTTF